ncbi:MAG: ABC transporter ATP-binding protein [Anaerolineaceae bacterium]
MTKLELVNVTCAYNENPVINNICLQAYPGKILALIGPNGVGKSTLLRTMGRLMRPLKGKVILVNRDLWQISPRDTARQMAFATQSNDMSWAATVEQFVAMGRAPHCGWFMPLSTHDHQIIQKAIEQVGLEHLRNRISTTLSGGEQQRMVLARVLAQEPSILLLDEPTTHLDLKYQTDILNLVHKLAQKEGLTVIVSLHDLNLAAIYSDRVALLSDGELAVAGTPAEVLTSEWLSQVYGVPILVMKHPLRDIPFILPNVGALEKIDYGT